MNVSKLDSAKEIIIKASSVSNATDYKLKLYCPGSDNMTSGYQEPFEWEMHKPGKGGTTPQFEVMNYTMPKCEFMTVRLVAFGENQIGDFIGASYYEKSIQVKGSSMGGPGGMMMGGMNEFKLTSAQSACFDAGLFKFQLKRAVQLARLSCLLAVSPMASWSLITRQDLLMCRPCQKL